MNAAGSAVRGGRRLGMPIEAWPEADRVGWLTACTPASPLALRPNGAGLAPTTRAAMETCYARWLLWVDRRDPDLLLLPPAARATEERVVAYAHGMLDEITLRTLVGYVSRLQSVLKLIAPETNWGWMTIIVGRIERRARQQPSAKHAFVPSQELYAFGLDLMREAEADGALADVARAETFRDGLAIAFLAARPLRRRNFIELTLGGSLKADRGGFRVEIPAERTKTRTALEFDLPDALAPWMQRYLDDHRVVLLDERRGGDQVVSLPDGPLWIVRSGAAWPSDTFADMISRRTLQRFGKRLTPHEFRHCAATSIAQNNPAEAGIIRCILGHTTSRTADKHYVHASSVHAAARYQTVVANVGKRAAGLRGTV